MERSSVTLAGRLLSAAIWLVIAGAIVWSYAWMASGGTWRYSSASAPYSEWLADAFLAGQLHLLIKPKPELLALPDPYDQVQSAPYREPDASLFNGKYYLYFGPVPGLIHAAWRLAFRERIEEAAMELVAAVGGCFWFWLLARRLRALAFPGLAPGWANLAALCYALGGVNLYLVSRTIGHHEMLLVGSFFVLGGYYFWLRGLEGGRLALPALFVGGLLLGLGFGSRHTLIGYPLACGLVMLGLWLRAPRDRTALSRLVAYGIGPGICVVLHLLYNYARFGSPLDFGVNYVLTGGAVVNLKSNFLGVLTLDNVVENLQSYTTYVPQPIAVFPFQVWPRSNPGSSGYFETPMMGMLIVAPLTLFMPLSLLLLSRRWRPDTARLVPWFIAGAAGGLVIPATVTLFQVAITARYLQDTLPVMTVLGAVGLWWLRDRAGSAVTRRAVQALAGVVLVLSVLMGGILAMAELNWDKRQAYTDLTYGFDRATIALLRVAAPSSWAERYAKGARERVVWGLPTGPFYLDGVKNDLIIGPEESVIRSMKVASAYGEPTRVILELNGSQVADERVFPGTQTIVLDEPLRIDPTKPVIWQIRLPDQPAEPPGALQRISVFGGNSQRDVAISDSQVTLLAELRKRVEQDQRLVEARRADLEPVLEQVRTLDAAVRAGTGGPEASKRLEEQKARAAALDQAYQEAVIKTTQDTESFRTEERYVQEQEARANAARAKP
jgi:hypothetical protein